MRLIRSGECRRMPWKNGGGETIEIAVFPAGASVHYFDWRLSTATVATDGPFSSFPGVDRTLAVLEGEGIDLDIAGRDPTRLTPAAPPHAFPADVPVAARLIDGPIRDLNLMTRRGRFAHEMRHHSAGRFELVVPSHAETVVFCASGWTSVGGRTPVRLAPHDAAILSSARHAVEISDGGSAFICSLQQASSSQPSD